MSGQADLPHLPEPHVNNVPDLEDQNWHAFTAEQMREYAAQCLTAAKSRASAAEAERDALALAEEGAKEAFGHVLQHKRDAKEECKRLRELLESAHAQIRKLAAINKGATHG